MSLLSRPPDSESKSENDISNSRDGALQATIKSCCANLRTNLRSSLSNLFETPNAIRFGPNALVQSRRIRSFNASIAKSIKVITTVVQRRWFAGCRYLWVDPLQTSKRRRMTAQNNPNQTAEAQRLALKWKPTQSGEAGD